MDSGSRCVQSELSDRYAHAAGPLVSDAKYALVVCHDDHRAICLGTAQQGLSHPAAIARGDEYATSSPKHLAPVLACLSDRGGVDDRHDVLEMLDDEPIEERLVAILETVEIDVLLNIRFLLIELITNSNQLLLDRRYVVRQQPVKAQRVALLTSERRALVEKRGLQQLLTAHRDAQESLSRLDALRNGVTQARHVDQLTP